MASRLGVGLTFQATVVRATVAISALASTAALFLITTTSLIAVFTVLIAVHGIGWGVLATVLLTLVLQDRGKRTAAVIIGFYIGVEGLWRMFAPAIAGTLGGLIGPVAGRIAGPAVGGVVAAVVVLQTIFIVVPAFSVVLILPLALRARGGMINGEN